MEAFIENLERLDSRQFAIALRKLANSLQYGVDRSPFVGSGVEYVQSRPYVEGDSIRAIDWRVTARTGRFHVKEFETPKSMPAYLLLDTSASMTVSSGARSKYSTALYIAGGLALACLDRVSPVGVLAVGERKLRVQPSLSSARVLQWTLELRRYRFDERTTLGATIHRLGPSLAQRSLIVVLSDLHDAEAVPALRRLSQLHDCVVLQLEDPAERGLAGAGFFRAREAESGREFLTRGKARWIDTSESVRALERAGVDHLSIRVDEPFEPKLRQLFRARGWTGKGQR